jgi:hypothetical protein
MAAKSWSFGMLKPHCRVAADRVTIARNVWLPLALVVLAAPGAWCLVQAFSHRHLDETMFGLGFAGVMLAVFALVMTPWLAPGRITCTREGITWGGTTYPRARIKSVRAMSNEVRSSRYGRYLSWTLVVSLIDGKPLVLSLGNRQLSASTDPLIAIAQAMTAVLA